MPNLYVQYLLILLGLIAVGSGNRKLIVFLICATWTMDLLSIRFLGPNIPLFRFMGFLLLPYTVQYAIKAFQKNATTRLLILNMAILILLGIVYGYLFPWMDTTGERPWTQRAEGRALISVFRSISDLSILFYMAKMAQDKEMLKWSIHAFFIGVVLNVLTATADLLTGHRLVEGWLQTGEVDEASMVGRLAGLTGEPRYFGRVCAIGLLVILCFPPPGLLAFCGMLIVAATGLALSGSSSALGGFAIAWVGWSFREILRRQFRLVAAGFIALVLLSGTLYAVRHEILENEISARMSTMLLALDRDPGEPWMVSSLEVFDRAAVRYFIAHPNYLLFGVGPDLISLPGSSYLSEVAIGIYGDRIDSVPHTGLISVVSSSGLSGLFIFGVAIVTLYRRLSIHESAVANKMVGVLLAVGIFSAIVMTSFLFIVIGLGIGCLMGAKDNRVIAAPA